MERRAAPPYSRRVTSQVGAKPMPNPVAPHPFIAQPTFCPHPEPDSKTVALSAGRHRRTGSPDSASNLLKPLQTCVSRVEGNALPTHQFKWPQRPPAVPCTSAMLSHSCHSKCSPCRAPEQCSLPPLPRKLQNPEDPFADSRRSPCTRRGRPSIGPRHRTGVRHRPWRGSPWLVFSSCRAIRPRAAPQLPPPTPSS